MTTPYLVGPPVKLPTDFFGRARQTRQFFETLAGPQVQCVSVLGLRRAGKTSFLQHVSHPQVMATYLPDAQRFATVYLDVSACKSPVDFYSRAYRQLLAFLSPRQAAGSALVADAYAVESLLYELADRRVVLLMDEFDRLRTSDFGQEFMTELRALASIWDYELGYVTASYWDLYRLGNFVGLPLTSPFYNIFHPTPIYLSGLSPDELNDLVRVPARRVGIAADDEDVAYVRHIAGSLPFFVQATAAVWLPYKQSGQQPNTLEVTRRLASELGPYFEQWWRNFSDVERDVLAAVAAEKPVARLPYSEAETAAAADRLRNYGVIASTGGQFWADSLLFKQWLREYGGRDARSHPLPSLSGHTHRETEPATAEERREQVLRLIQEAGRQLERLTDPIQTDGDLRDQLLWASAGRRSKTMSEKSLEAYGAIGLRALDAGAVLLAAECCRWRGQKSLLESVSLALQNAQGSRAAIILFARRQDYPIVVAAAAQAMPQHPDYLDTAGRPAGDRLDYRFRAANGTPPTGVNLSVLLFRLPG